MLSLLSLAAMGRLCVDDDHCAQGDYCKIELPPRIARACVEREEPFEVYDRCSRNLAHCCPTGTTCRGWFRKRCRPVIGQCEKKPEICCLAFPSCKEGYEIDNEEVCKDDDFATGRCTKETLCCSTITCVKKEKPCTLSCGTVVPSGWSGNDEGGNACNTCTCKDGGLGCTKIGCPARDCPKEKPCTLSCGTVVPSGWGGKDEGGNACNSCGCSNGNLLCTLAACGPDLQEKCPCNEFTKETPCPAVVGVCYNAGTCACENHPFQTNCFAAPCSVHSCPAGYKCRDNYCGGCNFQCTKEE